MWRFITLLILLCAPLAAASKQTPYGFSLLPQTITPKKMVFALYLQSDPDVYLQATSRNQKVRFRYSAKFMQFIKGLNLHKSDFGPFRAYLKNQIRAAKIDPAPFLELLETLLQNGATPAFTIEVNL